MADVTAPSPSGLAQPRATQEVAGVGVVWSPERGWLCQEHTAQPCTHTAGLPAPGKSPLWQQ